MDPRMLSNMTRIYGLRKYTQQSTQGTLLSKFGTIFHYNYFYIKVIYTWKGNFATDLRVHFFQIVNVGDDIDLNIFMSHFYDICS